MRKWAHLKTKGISGCTHRKRVKCFILVISANYYYMLSFSVRGNAFAEAEWVQQALNQTSGGLWTERCPHSAYGGPWISGFYGVLFWYLWLLVDFSNSLKSGLLTYSVSIHFAPALFLRFQRLSRQREKEESSLYFHFSWPFKTEFRGHLIVFCITQNRLVMAS